MQENQSANKKPKACKNCKHPNCPKCGTTHGMWECINSKEGATTQEVTQ